MKLAASLIGLISISFAARADVLPRRGYVETCTLEKQQKPGEDCRSIRISFRDFQAGQKEYGSKGYARRCSTHGASVRTEIWCRAAGETKDDKAAEKVTDEP